MFDFRAARVVRRHKRKDCEETSCPQHDMQLPKYDGPYVKPHKYGEDCYLYRGVCPLHEIEVPKDYDGPYCPRHETTGHAYTDKCDRHCSYCGLNGHTMLFCRKMKDCKLCGKSGHNPIKCWKYCTIRLRINRATELGRCYECLRPFTLVDRIGWCDHCLTPRLNASSLEPTLRSFTKETQTEENSYLVQECQTELKEGKAIIESQTRQIEELSNKISSLEDKLEGSMVTIRELNWQLQNTLKEKEQELQKLNSFDSLVKEKDMELRKLQEQIKQKDLELERHRQTSAQSPQSIPAAAQQPCPTLYNRSEYINETNGINATLKDLQDQQQKLSVVVNYICNKIRTQDMYWHNQSSFNPYLGPYDTGQYFNKVQQV